MHAQNIDQPVAKLKQLPPERLAEVEDFIDLISQRETGRTITQVAKAITEPVLNNVWVDILPALKDGDSFLKTAMPGREYVPCRVDVAVVSDTTLTCPYSYS
jgi:glutamine synthetase adenylyltransferase